MATNFATRYKKDLSTQTLRTKLASRKSISQKESRHNEFNKGRQLGLLDVNTQASRGKEFSLPEDSGEGYLPKNKAKPGQYSNTTVKTRGQERMEMLQRYKAEKELRKLKEQREKPIFRCGRFKPEDPVFVPKPSQIPVLSKPKEKEAAPLVRMTRSKTKTHLQEPVGPPARPHPSGMMPVPTSKGSHAQTGQQKQNRIYLDKPPHTESKERQPAGSTATHGRTTRAAAHSKTRIPQASRPAGNASNLPQRSATQKGKQPRGVRKEEATASPSVKDRAPAEPEKGKAKLQLAAEVEQDVAFIEKENLPVSPILASVPPRRTRSFAPQNFVFKPLEGLSTYRVKPMSPSRADVFLSPHLFWSPMQTNNEVLEEGAEESELQDCNQKTQLSPLPEVTREDFPEHPSSLGSVEVKAGMPPETRDTAPAEEESGRRCADLPATAPPDPTAELQHGVPYFRNILQSETERLSSCCLEWDGTAEMDIPEDAKDLVRTTVGQTRLLIAERFKQFEGLVDNCEFRRGEKATTCTDLAGFWDMVNFQVEDVNKKFENLRKLQMNGWQIEEDVQSRRPAKKKPALQRAVKARDGSAERTAARKRIAAIKAALKNKMKQDGLVKEAAEQVGPTEAEKITFDGGFFQIESPAKPFPGRTPATASRTSRRTSRQAAPRSATKALLQSCADTCVIQLGLPAASQALLPLPDLNALWGSAGSDPPRSLSKQSDIRTAEDSHAIAAGPAEEAVDTQMIACHRQSSSKDLDGLVPARRQGLGNSSLEKEEPEMAEEVCQTTAVLNDRGVLCGPKEDSHSEGICSQSEGPHTPESLLGDISYDSGILDHQQGIPETSLFFTPIRNEAVKSTADATFNDLIVFSPLPPLDGEK
ncbi:disks large-associated protein 5 [Varanus komodoensis]|uniref:disks large-associated protein 5 n=1 Tax=Varanus komodoensis TaxID=61221 RepID=UPI001CF7C4A0|nr:disks large-associated protein 5 [Varanus komodoensis]